MGNTTPQGEAPKEEQQEEEHHFDWTKGPFPSDDRKFDKAGAEMWLTYTKAKIDEYEAQRSRFQDDEDKTDEQDLISEILEGIIEVIVKDREDDQSQETMPDIKTHRKAFMLLMLLVMNERLQEIVKNYFNESERVGTIVQELNNGMTNLDKNIKTYAQDQEENAKQKEGDGGGDDDRQARKDNAAAAEGGQGAGGNRDQGDDSEEFDSEDDDDGGEGLTDYKKLQFKAQRINVLFYTLALIGENLYDQAKVIVKDKDLMSRVSLLMQVSESNDTDRNLQKRLVKGAAVLVASLSSTRSQEDPSKLELIQKQNTIQATMNRQTGLIMNFCLNLVSMKELGNNRSITQTVGNLAVLREIQENQFLLKVGLPTILNKLMGLDAQGQRRKQIKVSHIQLMIQSARTIFLLARTQNSQIIKRLNELKIVQMCLELYEKYSKVTITGGQVEGMARNGKIENDSRCEMLLFYCKLILLEMSHDSLRQQEIIQKDGVRILETLEQFNTKNTKRFYSNYLSRHTDQFKTPQNQLKNIERLFKESMLNFVIGIKNILYTSLVPFLVRECFDRILLIDDENKLRQLESHRMRPSNMRSQSSIDNNEISDDTEEEDKQSSAEQEREGNPPPKDTDDTYMNNQTSFINSTGNLNVDLTGRTVTYQQQTVFIRSNSESFKCIEALLKLFMTKQAHRQIKIANRTPFNMMGTEEDVGEGSAIFSMIIQYVKRLEKYTTVNLPSFLDHESKQTLHRSSKGLKAFQDQSRVKTNFRHAKLQKYINVMTILTNCLASKMIITSLLEERPRPDTLIDIAKTLANFHENLLPQIYECKNIKETNLQRSVAYEQTNNLNNEVTLGIFLLKIVIEQQKKALAVRNQPRVPPSRDGIVDRGQIQPRAPSQKPFVNFFGQSDPSEEKVRLQWLIDLVQNSDKDYQVYKALVCLKNLCTDWSIVEQLYEKNIIDVLRKLLEQNQSQLVKVIAQLITKMVMRPQEMRLWLKFDAANSSISSADCGKLIITHGKPGHMPPDRGIYRNWGTFFDFGDSLEIAGGFNHKGNKDTDQPQLEWSITFWTVLPAVYNGNEDRILVQAYDGKGAYVMIDKEGHLVSIDEVDPNHRVDSGIDLTPKKTNKKWHHIAVVCQYEPDTMTQRLSYFRDGTKVMKDESTTINLRKRIGYIGNCKQGNKPFGVVADLRIYPHRISRRQLMKLCISTPEFEKEMPDKYQINFIKLQIPQMFIYKIEEESAATNVKILNMLSSFATKREGRAELLRHDILDIILPLQKHQEPTLRFAVQKLIFNLI